MTSSALRPVRFTVNGSQVALDVEPRRLLADVLRDDLGLKGTHLGCEHGVCGACTVLMDGLAVRSCLVLIAQIDGHEVATVEALRDGDQLHGLQEAFKRAHALQCGFCTSGFLMTALALQDSEAVPCEAEIREYLSGNICRCTGYANIVDAVIDWLSSLASVSGGN